MLLKPKVRNIYNILTEQMIATDTIPDLEYVGRWTKTMIEISWYMLFLFPSTNENTQNIF